MRNVTSLLVPTRRGAVVHTWAKADRKRLQAASLRSADHVPFCPDTRTSDSKSIRVRCSC